MNHERNHSGPPTQPAPKMVLVAITDLFFYTKVRDALRQPEYQLEKARTQADIIEKAQSASLGAIIFNMNDPTLDAFQALDKLKADSQLKGIPTLAFANHEEVDTWNRAKALGVTKVVSRNEFSARTKDLVEEVLATRPHPSPSSTMPMSSR